MANRSILNEFGFSCRKKKIVYSIPHPCNPSRNLYAIPDFIHAFKNLKEMLMKIGVILLPEDVVTMYKLQSQTVDMKYVEWLEDKQSGMNLKFNPKLKKTNLKPNHFNKMKVTTATNVISPETAGALYRLSEITNNSVMQTTAWFILMLRHLFKIMTSHDRLFALSFHKIDWYHTAIEIIHLFICIFKNATIEGDWKVTRTHMIMCLQAILEIQEELLQTESFDFLCLARFSQDCIENEFSNIRIQRPKPSALECKNRLKQLAVSRKAVSISNSSYNFDDSLTLIDLMSRKEKPKQTDTLSSDMFSQLHLMESLTDEEEEILYKMCGYIVLKLKQRIKCANCYSKLLHSGPIAHPRSGFLQCCEFLEGALVSVSDEVFQLLKVVELIIRGVKNKIKDIGQTLKEKLEQYLKKELSTFIISTCHNTKDILISRYCSMRLCQIASELSNMSVNTNNLSTFSSKSMGSRLLADNFNPKN